jgi:hypothetical protein
VKKNARTVLAVIVAAAVCFGVGLLLASAAPAQCINGQCPLQNGRCPLQSLLHPQAPVVNVQVPDSPTPIVNNYLPAAAQQAEAKQAEANPILVILAVLAGGLVTGALCFKSRVNAAGSSGSAAMLPIAGAGGFDPMYLVAAAAGALIVYGIFKLLDKKLAVDADLQEAATLAAKYGLDHTTRILHALASGNLPAAVAEGKVLLRALRDPKQLKTLLQGVADNVTTAQLADPAEALALAKKVAALSTSNPAVLKAAGLAAIAAA